MSDYNTPSEVELTTEHTAFVSKAGASDVFMDLLTFPKEEGGVSRHSIRQEIKEEVYWGHISPENDPATFSPRGGHFFSAMWDGDLFWAWTRADLNNKMLLRECFGFDRIIRDGIEEGEPTEYVERMVTEPAL
jgi:hypothetical protein